MLCRTLRKSYNATVSKNNYGGVPTSGWTGTYHLHGNVKYYDMSDFLSEEEAYSTFNKYLINLIKDLRYSYDEEYYHYDDDYFYD